MSRSISINAFKQTEIQRDCIIQRQILWAWNDGEYAAPFVSTVFAGFLPIFPNKLNASLRSFAKISDCHAVARGLACVPFPQSLVCCWRYVVSASKAFWWSRLHLFITPATIFVICRHASCSHHVLIMFSSCSHLPSVSISGRTDLIEMRIEGVSFGYTPTEPLRCKSKDLILKAETT